MRIRARIARPEERAAAAVPAVPLHFIGADRTGSIPMGWPGADVHPEREPMTREAFHERFGARIAEERRRGRQAFGIDFSIHSQGNTPHQP